MLEEYRNDKLRTMSEHAFRNRALTFAYDARLGHRSNIEPRLDVSSAGPDLQCALQLQRQRIKRRCLFALQRPYHDPRRKFLRTTLKGGTYEKGTVYELRHVGSGWVLYLLYEFQGGTDGADPVSGVTIGPSGVLYGTTEIGGDQSCGVAGGCGTVYSLRPPVHASGSASAPWTESVVYRFQGVPDGARPQYGSLVYDANGNFYGTTQYGGQLQDCGSSGCGTVYELSPTGGAWTESVLHSFNARDDGSQPLGGIIRDQYNDLYGVTSVGNETFFTLQPSGNGFDYYDVQGFYPNIGCDIDTSLLLDPSDFNFYGVAQGCGPGGSTAGTIFDWFYGFSQVYNFGTSRGGVTAPEGPLIEDSATDLFGVSFNGGAYQQGNVYKMAYVHGSYVYTDLYDFTGGSDGAGPVGNLVMDASGNLYGVTSGGGSHSGGVIFEITP